MSDGRIITGQSIEEALLNRSATLELNRQQREGLRGLNAGGNPHAFGQKGSTQTWGRPMIRVPVADYVQLCKRNPALLSKDWREFSAAWLEFERSDESIPYRMIEDAIHGPRNTVYTGAG